MSAEEDNKKTRLKMKQIVEALNQLAGDGKIELQRALGQTAVSQATLGIRRSENPYGDPFEPLKTRTGIPLRRTGNHIQRAWTSGQETPTSFVFGNSFKYLATHQYGAVIRAKPGKALRFWVEGALATQDIRMQSRIIKSGKNKGKERLGKVVIKKGEATQYNMVMVQKVTIPRRQMVPEQDTGGLGPRWTRAFERTIRKYIETILALKKEP